MSTKIEWTRGADGSAGKTWNPVTGCTRASAGCDNCYAVTMTHRLAGMGQAKKYGGLTVLNPKGDRHFNGVVRCHDDALDIPLKIKKPTTWFVNSMSDLFHKEVPFEFIDKVFAVMALCLHHTFQCLTKRPERMREYLKTENRSCIIDAEVWELIREGYEPDENGGRCRNLSEHPIVKLPLRNVWLGCSVENQETANERIPHLLECPAAVRFLSYEPALGPIKFADVPGFNKSGSAGREVLDRFWVIAGGESGHHARPCNIEWIRSIVQQCKAAGVACFVKQLGAKPCIAVAVPPEIKLNDPKGGDPAEWPEDLRVREMPR